MICTNESYVSINKKNCHTTFANVTMDKQGEETVTELKSEETVTHPLCSDSQIEPSDNQEDLFSKEEIHQIEQEHEPFLLHNENGKLLRVSELDLAVLYQNHRFVVFLPQEDQFYRYIPQTGKWEVFSLELLEKDLTDFSNNFFSSTGRLSAFQKLGHQMMVKVIAVLKTRISDEKFFEKPEVEALYCIHCANCMVEFNPETKSWAPKSFSPKYRSRENVSVVYDPQAVAEDFTKKLVNQAMNEDDRAIFQQYAGQCLLGRNRSEKFLVVTGTPGGGKSTMVNVLRKIIGLRKCAELRLQHSNGRFEISHYVGKSLLIGSDVPSDFLNRKGSERLKSYVGKDPLNFEYKCSSKFGEITGEFNVIITSNTTLQVRLDNDHGAWARRMLWIRFENPPPETPIPDFDDLLVNEEASGIVNWMLEGATSVILNGGHIRPLPQQQERVNLLLEETNPVQIFVRDYIVKDEASDMTNRELWNAFNSIRESRDFPVLKRASFNKILADVVDVQLHCGLRHDIVRAHGSQSGFKGICFRTPL